VCSGLTPPPGGRRIHPLSAYPPSAIWHRLQHTFVGEPDLPKPLLEPNSSINGDIAICARLIDAFSRAVAYEQDNIPPQNRPNDGLISHHGEARRLLASKDAAGLADYLRNGLRTPLCTGLGPGPSEFQTISGPDWQDPVLRLVDYLAALAEAIGALSYEHPGHGRYGQNINLSIPELTHRIESKLRFPIDRPKVMGNYGIGRDSGVIDSRVPDDAYCAHRIKFICDDISNTRFMEVGGGFGGMALFALRAGATRWPIVDLPIMNVVQGYFLIKCLGGNNVRLFGEDNPAGAVEALPYWEFFDRARDYSVVFNRFSMVEIERDRVDEYLAEIETRGAIFLSINHENGTPSQLTCIRSLPSAESSNADSAIPIGSERVRSRSCSLHTADKCSANPGLGSFTRIVAPVLEM